MPAWAAPPCRCCDSDPLCRGSTLRQANPGLRTGRRSLNQQQDGDARKYDRCKRSSYHGINGLQEEIVRNGGQVVPKPLGRVKSS